jgi:hypothetical protein
MPLLMKILTNCKILIWVNYLIIFEEILVIIRLPYFMVELLISVLHAQNLY